jgi:hypothetical protein
VPEFGPHLSSLIQNLALHPSPRLPPDNFIIHERHRNPKIASLKVPLVGKDHESDEKY